MERSLYLGRFHDRQTIGAKIPRATPARAATPKMSTILLETLLQRRVELITREALSSHIGPHILEEVEYAALPS